eukprot:s30_g38.t1
MAELSAELCGEIDDQGKAFTLEHPGNSIALCLDSWVRLRQRKGVHAIFYHTCRFRGSRRKKYQVLITNRKGFIKHIAKLCDGGLCQRTGQKHLRWRPTVSGGKVIQFQTGDEREYPIGFCDEYAEAAVEVLKESGTFVEVFSGANAPLSAAIGRRFGVTVPGHALRTEGHGVLNEVQSLEHLGIDLSSKPVSGGLADVRTPLQSTDLHTVRTGGEESYNRKVTIQAAKQPGYGKRVQLIPDGTNDPRLHLEQALKLEHPFSSETTLKPDHAEALSSMSKVSSFQTRRRLQTLSEWISLAKSHDIVQKQHCHEGMASQCAKRLGRKPRTALMEALGIRYHIEDSALPMLCLTGMPIVGRALESPFFEEYHVPASITLAELLKTAPARRGSVLGRVRMMGRMGGPELAEAIWRKTMKEVAKGTMSGPYTVDAMLSRHGTHFNVVPSFGLKQGHDEHGNPKFRRIDDHTASHNNLAAERRQRIQMSMVDYLMVMIAAASKQLSRNLVISTEDMAGAYRQVPLCDTHVGISITAVYDPDSGEPALFELYGQPFGAAHAVPNFYRLAEWASRLLTRGFHLLIDHFFDDFFAVLPQPEASTTMFCVREAFKLLGLSLDPDKSQAPSEVAMVLGVAINTASLSSQGLLLVEPKPTRVANLTYMIDQIIASNTLTPSVAASLLGKFGFLCSTMYGKVGRCCTSAVRTRQYQTGDGNGLTPALLTCLNLMKIFVNTAPSRQLKINDNTPPIILYTDASDVPERDPRWVLGCVLIDPCESFQVEYTSWTVPQSIVDTWVAKQSYMGQLELLACPLAICTWKHRLRSRQVLLFCDNDSAASNLVKGYSSKTDSSKIVGLFWLLCSDASTEVYLDRVESKSNLADGPSRLEFSLLQQLSAERPANHLLANKGYTAKAPAVRKYNSSWAVAKGDFVRGSCRLVLDASLARGNPAAVATLGGKDLWERVWRVDMPCETSEELPTCPICLGEPEVIRTPQCGHVICLVCALRLRQQAAQTKTAAKCPVCSKGVRLEDLRPVRLEPQHLPKPEECQEGLRFSLVRRTGMHHLSLASETLPSNYRPHLPLEGEPGALFARRIFGDVELYLSALHEDLHTLEAIAAQGSEEAALLEPALKMLRARLAEDFKGAEGLKESDDGGAEQLVFYQSSDGQLIFLEPHLMKRLLASYSTWGRLPPSVLLKPLKSMRQEALTDEMKKRHRFLLHLPSDAAGNLISFADGEVVCDLKQANGSIDTEEVKVEEVKEAVEEELELSLWTRQNWGIPFTGFICGFMLGLLMGTRYGFFLGYLGLKPYVMLAAGSIMKIPEVLLLPLGILTDSFPIFGMHRKPYLLIAWIIVGTGLLMISIWPLPDPYYCIGPDGNYNYMLPPCNPSAHEAKNFYVACSVLVACGLCLAQVAGDGLIIQYSQKEPIESRGKIKAEVMMMMTAGMLAANLTVAFLMNSKEYLGTFDWGLGYDGCMIIALCLVCLLFVATVFFIREPKTVRLHRSRSTIRSNLKDSWTLMKSGAFMGILMFGFATQMMVHVNTTAGPLVKKNWAEVKVLPAQLYHMGSSVAEIAGVFLVKKYLLQSSWRRIFFSACVLAVILDAIPAFLTVFNIVRNQYFYLGEEILAALPMAAIKLVSGLVLIEMAEPGREGLAIGLMGTVTQASAPFGTAISNQIFALFHPNLSDVQNYETDTDAFRRTVAWSYVVSYVTTLASFFLVYLIPNQKQEAQQRKERWGHSRSYGVLVLLLPSICCCYSLVLLVLTNMESTACMPWVGGMGCDN